MPILPIIKYPNPLLREVSSPVTEFDNDLKEFMHSLFETMYHEKGVGMAAIQVGNPIRAMVIDIPASKAVDHNDPDAVREPLFIINPEINYFSQETIVLKEGCISVRGDDGETIVKGEVLRPVSVNVTYYDLDEELHELKIDGTKSDYHKWLARCVQHEVDHMDGILFIDKLYESHFENVLNLGIQIHED